MIYAIHAVGTDYVKFGKAGNVERRLLMLQTGSPHELRVLARADWPDEAEAKIHKLLRSSRRRGEWFALDKSAVNVLGLMRDGSIAKLDELSSAPAVMGQNTLKRLFHLTKEDFGVWRTSESGREQDLAPVS